MYRSISGSIAAACLLTGCLGDLNPRPENTRIDRVTPNLRVVTYDAGRRGVFVKQRGATNEIVCAEPPPDVSTNYYNTASIGGEVGATGKASAPNPVHAALGGVGALVSLDGLRSAAKKALKPDGTPILNLAGLADADLLRVTAAINVGLAASAVQSQSTTQIVISDTIRLLRSSHYWSCINQANRGQEYDAAQFRADQMKIEEMVSSLISGINQARYLEAQAQLISAHAQADAVKPSDVGRSSSTALRGPARGATKPPLALAAIPGLSAEDVKTLKQAQFQTELARLTNERAALAADSQTQASISDPLGLRRGDRAGAFMREAYKQLFTVRDLAKASAKFSEAEKIYPAYQNAYEMTRLIAEVQPSWCSVLTGIRNRRLTYGMTESEMGSYKAGLQSCPASAAKK